MKRDPNGLPRWVGHVGLFVARLVALQGLAAAVVIPATVLIRVVLAALG